MRARYGCACYSYGSRRSRSSRTICEYGRGPRPRILGRPMYPLNVTLIGCQDSLQRNVLSMLINQQANLDGQYADVDSAVAALRDDPNGQRLFIMHVPDSYMLPKLRQLVGV